MARGKKGQGSKGNGPGSHPKVKPIVVPSVEPQPVSTETAADTTTGIVKRENSPSVTPSASLPQNETVYGREPFHLMVERMGEDSPNIRVSWCIARETISALEHKHCVTPGNARMLLVVTHETDGKLEEVERHLLDIDTPVHYLSFDRPGTHRIHGFIVWCEVEKKRSAHTVLFNWFVDTKSDAYIKHLTDGHTARIAAGRVPHLEHVAERKVEVSHGFFAQKPNRDRSSWFGMFWWWFANLWYETEPADQCEYRQRSMFAVCFKSWFVPIYWMGCTLGAIIGATALLLIGRRPSYMNFKAIGRPFTYQAQHLVGEPDHHLIEAQAYYWLTNSQGLWRPTPLMVPILTPLVWLIALISGYHLSVYLELSWGIFLNTILTAIGAVAGVTVAWVFLILVIGVVHEIVEANQHLQDPEKMARRERAEHEAQKREAEEIAEKRRAYYRQLYNAPIACDSPTALRHAPTVWELKRRDRTLALMFRDVKARVCKPFARS